ncbi:hypothetical protein ISF6_4974 [Piscinibacter sakaiensis]|uniref:Carbohydrate binding module xylan-binding domain-containing protein n=2 Tax=Piscinibacter sakaiensis TaxID=1547922 RepID=A0A0K8P7B6_PISS1|nr:hypothetical protein ISF6_4974 [Piscinibacter sakaiensis]
MSFRNPCAGQVQLAGSPAVGIRRFVFGGLPAGEECRALAAQAGDVVPGVEAGPVRMQPGDAMHGRIETAGDVDAYGIALQAGVTYRFELKGASSGVGTLVDPYLALYSPTLQSLRENNNAASGTRDAALSFTAPTTDTYYLAARANGTGTGSFVLSASGVASDLVAQPVRPASDFSGTLNLALTGQQSGSLQLNIGASGNITGSLQWAGGTPLAVYGLLQAGGVFSVNAGGANFAGYVGTDGRAFGVWRTVGGTPQGGLVQGAGAVTLPASTLTVRARGSLNAGVGPTMVLRVDGAVVGSVVVQSTEPADYRFEVPRLVAGSRVDLVFTNDAWAEGQDRNLYISYVTDGRVTVLPTQPGAQVDWGSGERAWDGLDVIAGQGDLYSSGALRLTWPGAPAADPQAAQRRQAARLLMQASFGPSPQDIAEVLSRGEAGWIADQMARPPTPDFVGYVQGQWNQGDAFRPGGSSYDAMATVRAFWNAVATGPDPLRKRVAWSLHQIFVVSQADSNLYGQVRAYAGYLDILNRHAFGSYRQLLEDIALSPAMGIYLSHMRNRKEDPATGRVPDENFAREVMQLFSIGLVELNPDGTPKRGANGQPIETYGNADVMAMAKVFTGWSWGFPDNQLTDSNFRWGWPKYGAAEDQQIDLQPMKPYPNFHSGSEKVLFAGKPWAVTIPAGTPARESLRIALDTLANHPNVGPFLGRQLIQRLVTSNPSPAYVERVAAAFANNGQGVRGDLGAVVRAVLLDPEARPATPGPGFGKLREPVLRVAHWMRAFGARSTSGTYAMVWDLEDVNQRPFHPPSVFSYFRPGYVPPNTALAEADATAPEFQLLNETTAPQWVNLAEGMAGGGLGWSAGGRDVVPDLAGLQALVAAGDIDGLIALLDERLFAGRMSAALRQDILDALAGVGGSSADSQLNRVRVAVFVALASPEFLVQR